MIRRSTCALAFLLAATACRPTGGGGDDGGADVVGSGTPARASRSVPTFTAIDASGAFALEVESGAKAADLVIEGDDNIVPLFVAEVSGGTLSLHLPGGSYALKSRLVVHVAASSVTRLVAAGAIEADLHGLAGDRFDVDLSGACRVGARGTVDRFALQATGANDVAASALVARAVELHLSGASKAHVQATEALTVEANGASHVLYRGKPRVETSASGTSSVDPE